jgi:hypothetical protein
VRRSHRVFDNSTHPAVLFLSTKKGVYFSYTFPITYELKTGRVRFLA